MPLHTTFSAASQLHKTQPWFRHLPPGQQAHVAESVVTRRGKKGDVLLRSGDAVQDMR